jgi:hypothetical protein
VKNTFLSFQPYLSRESILAISSADFSFTYLKDPLQSLENRSLPVVISAEAWSSERGGEFLNEIAKKPAQVRVQISVGAEFMKHEAKLLAFLKQGGACDLLFDRPLAKGFEAHLQQLLRNFDLRLCLVANRYFATQATVSSLSAEVQEKLFILFLPPQGKGSCYLSNDEVIRELNGLSADRPWNALIFSNVVEQVQNTKDRYFFADLDPEAYYSRPHLMDGYNWFRNTIVWLAKKKFIWLLDILYSFMIFLKDPRNFIRFRTWASFRHAVHMSFVFIWHRVSLPVVRGLKYRSENGKSLLRHLIVMSGIWFWHRLAIPLVTFVRYKILLQAYNFIRYRLWSLGPQIYIFARHRVWPLLPRLYIFLRHTVWPTVFTFIVYRMLHPIFIFLRYRMVGYLYTLLYPMRKIYWFVSFQYDTRIRPFLSKESKDQ